MNTKSFSKEYEKVTTEPDNPYDINAVGCYVDSARGIYAINAILRFAEDHVFKLDEETEKLYAENDYSLSDFVWSCEVEDQIDDHMNTKYPVDGAYWGRSEQGDWGLWTTENA